jgi:hypothetical protein
MTTLMMWNINRFTQSTIYPEPESDDFADQLLTAALGIQCTEYVVTTAVNADIFVLIEVQSTKGELGTLIGGNGATGVLLLLEYLRVHNEHWCVVPPPKLVGLTETGEKTNYTESIAVFFRSDKLDFIGPYVWPKDNPERGAKRGVPAGAATGPYPDPWAEAKALPDKNYYAAQYQYLWHDGKDELVFTDSNMRRPLLTVFRESGDNGRLIKILATHPSPNKDTTVAVSRLLSVPEIGLTDKPQVVAIGGDLNLDVFAATGLDTTALQLLRQYLTQHFTTGNGGTMILPADSKKEEKNGTPTTYRRLLGLDNMFTRYDGGLKAPKSNATIIDRVKGLKDSPYSCVMLLTIPQLDENYLDEKEKVAEFRKPQNYGHIAHWAGVSDHLPIVIDL